MSDGWIKLHRKLLESPVFRDSKLLHTWIMCLLEAAHAEHVTLLGRREVSLQPGEFVTGRQRAGQTTGLTEQEVRSALKTLESMRMIERRSTNKGSVVMVKNWGKYQTSDSETSKQPAENSANQGVMKNDRMIATSKQPAANQQVTTTEEYKETTEREITAREYFQDGSIRGDLSESDCLSVPNTLGDKQNAPAGQEGGKNEELEATPIPSDVSASAGIVLGLTSEPILLDWHRRGWAWDWISEALAITAGKEITGARGKRYAEVILQDWTAKGGPQRERNGSGGSGDRQSRTGSTPSRRAQGAQSGFGRGGSSADRGELLQRGRALLPDD